MFGFLAQIHTIALCVLKQIFHPFKAQVFL
uniref:Uncharacterized protein n=1 Tax=Anguilla anguilla TaxID=7936 RepID=A0A0E9QJG3_ANGAN